ncbi:MAG: hypothetical protein HY721_32860 [Planctomycetes bacterium]|nr:hypothetical protein [Planctomycetota bacterium]
MPAAPTTSVYHLVVSVPPHAEGWRAEAAADCFGVTPAEVRVRASHPAPEVWFADPDEAAAEEAYGRLLEAGLNVVFTDSSILGAVPPRRAVRSLTVARAGIVWDLGNELTAETPFSTRGILVYGKPRTATQHKPGAATADGRLANPTFVDLYFEEERGAQRLHLASGAVKFTGLGERMRSTFGENVEALAALLRERLRAVREDGRLMDVPPRLPPVSGAGLPRVLESLKGSIRGVDPLELASRLVFLTSSWA